MVAWTRTLAVGLVSSGQILAIFPVRFVGSERKRGIKDGAKIFGGSRRMNEMGKMECTGWEGKPAALLWSY